MQPLALVRSISREDPFVVTFSGDPLNLLFAGSHFVHPSPRPSLGPGIGSTTLRQTAIECQPCSAYLWQGKWDMRPCACKIVRNCTQCRTFPSIHTAPFLGLLIPPPSKKAPPGHIRPHFVLSTHTEGESIVVAAPLSV